VCFSPEVIVSQERGKHLLRSVKSMVIEVRVDVPMATKLKPGKRFEGDKFYGYIIPFKPLTWF